MNSYWISLFGLLVSIILANSKTLKTVYCDVIVAGGSTAALAASISAARRSPVVQVCLTEPTDWLGGQLTAAGVPAIDFGNLNRQAKYQASDFVDMLASLGSGNCGNCWVSTKCFQPRHLITDWINKTVSSYTNLAVLYNTVVKRVLTNGRRVVGLVTVQRLARPGTLPWRLRYSDTVSDWYSETDSASFTKTVITLLPRKGSHPVVIEATELGDVLVLSGATFRQGVELPYETSTQTLDTCGQAFTFPFYMTLFNHSVPGGNWPKNNRTHAPYSLGQTWGEIWSYRRVLADGGTLETPVSGEISNQNWASGNDYREGYMLLPLDETLAQKVNWSGGLNLNSVATAELRAYGWYWYYKQQAPADLNNRLRLDSAIVSGTQTGLSKIPYIRDTRRSVGNGDFVLMKKDMTANNNSSYGINFTDSISLGDYYAADVHSLLHCSYPPYVNVYNIVPYTIPFRALSNKDFDNLLVAGKTMAQTFMGNAATRLHPMEWSTGLSAGLAAVMMSEYNLSSSSISSHYIQQLQTEVKKYMPISWPPDG